MGLIDSFWGPRDNPQPRKKHGKHRASRGTSSIPPKPLSSAPAPAAEERWSTRTSIEAPTVARQYSDFAGGPASRSGLAAHQSFTPVRGSFVPVQAGPAASPLDWAKQHKYKAAAGVGGAAALLLYFMKPAQASVVTTPAVVEVTPAVDQSNLGKALGVGAFVAVAAGVALYASENE